jgi:hypothetical protein
VALAQVQALQQVALVDLEALAEQAALVVQVQAVRPAVQLLAMRELALAESTQLQP